MYMAASSMNGPVTVRLGICIALRTAHIASPILNPCRVQWRSDSAVPRTRREGAVRSVCDLATGWTDDQGSIFVRGGNFISSPQRPDRLWGPPSILYSAYRELFPSGQSGRGMGLNTHLHLMPRLRIRGAIPPLPILFILY